MPSRVVLVSNPDEFRLTPSYIKKLGLENPVWLSEKRAVEAIAPAPVTIKKDPVDVFTFPVTATKRRFSFLFCDMDSTILKDESFEAMGPLLKKDSIEKINHITHEAMEGRMDFESALRERVVHLKGLTDKKLVKVASTMEPSAGAKTLIATMKRNGAYCVLISGGFTHFTAETAQRLGFDEHHGNHLVTKEGVVTGELSGVIIDKEQKGQICKRILQRFGASKDKALAVGDGANDIRLFQECGMGIAYHGKDILKKYTPYHINHTDLTSLLYAQGFNDSQIITC